MKTFGEIVVNLWNNLNKGKASNSSKYSEAELKQAYDFNEKFHSFYNEHKEETSLIRAHAITVVLGPDAPPVPIGVFLALNNLEEDISITGNVDTE